MFKKKYSVILLSIIGIIVINIFFISLIKTEQLLSVLVIFMLFAIIGLLINTKLGLNESKLFIIVYYLNVFAVIALYIIYMNRYGQPYYIGGSDDLGYEMGAQKIVQSLGIFDYFSIRGNILPNWHNSVGYVYLISLFYRVAQPLGGFHTFIPRIFNSFILALLSILVYHFAIYKLKLNLSISFGVALIVGLAPIMMYNSAHTFRDIIVAFLMFLCIYIWNDYDKYVFNKQIIILVITLLIIFILWETRSLTAILTVLLICFSYLDQKRKMIKTFKSKQNIFFLFFILFGISVFFYCYSQGYIGWLSNRLITYYVSYNKYVISKSEGFAKFGFDAIFPLNYLFRFIYLSIYPIPILSSEIERLWLSTGTIIQIFFLPYVIIGLRRLIKKKLALNIAFGFLVIFISVSIFSFTFRHISMFYPFGVLVAGYGYNYFQSVNRKYIWLGMYSLFLSGVIIYILAKYFL